LRIGISIEGNRLRLTTHYNVEADSWAGFRQENFALLPLVN